MATNFRQEGRHLEITNGTGGIIASGSPVFQGKIIGIALGTIAIGGLGRIQTYGVWSLAKKAALEVSEGDALYWDATPGELTKTEADGNFVGFATAAAAADDATAEFLIVQNPAAAGFPTAATVAALVDNSGGAGADGTIAVLVDAGGTAAGAPTTASVANAITELSTKVNAILTSIKAAGLMA